MFRQIVTPQNTQLLLQIPEEFVGKKVEAIAFMVNEEKKHFSRKTEDQKIKEFYHSVNIVADKDFKFNREDTHER